MSKYNEPYTWEEDNHEEFESIERLINAEINDLDTEILNDADVSEFINGVDRTPRNLRDGEFDEALFDSDFPDGSFIEMED